MTANIGAVDGKSMPFKKHEIFYYEYICFVSFYGVTLKTRFL